MKRIWLAAIITIVLILSASPAHAQYYDDIEMQSSQSYLRMGMNDTVTLTVQLYDHDNPASAAGVPVLLNFLSAKENMIFDKQLIVTDEKGNGSTTIRVNPDNPPDRYRLPVMVQIEAATEYHRTSLNVYITGTAPVSGYVLNDEPSIITGANITVKGPDGRLATYLTYPILSGDGSGSPMGYYRIDGLPTDVGKFEITAEKGGLNGTTRAEAGYEGIRNDITIRNYRDYVNISQIVKGSNQNMQATQKAAPTATPTPDAAEPTSMTTTIIAAIVLIALIYIGLKAYRRMF